MIKFNYNYTGVQDLYYDLRCRISETEAQKTHSLTCSPERTYRNMAPQHDSGFNSGLISVTVSPKVMIQELRGPPHCAF